MKYNLFSYLPTPQQNHLLQTCLTNLIKSYAITPLNQHEVFKIFSVLLNYNEPQMNTDEHRFRMQYPCLSVFIRG